MITNSARRNCNLAQGRAKAAQRQRKGSAAQREQQLMRLAKWITAICFVAQTANRMAQCGMKLLAAATPALPYAPSCIR